MIGTMERSFWSVAAVFRVPFLERVALGTHTSVMLELADSCSKFGVPSVKDDLRHWFDFFYSLLFHRYRCEYIYKNAIATKLFLSRHSLQNSFMTDELRSSTSRADVAILNGTSTVYEIKSEYDSFDRLHSQLADYTKIFDRIYVVTSERKAPVALRRSTPPVGVIAMRKSGALSVLREAEPNRHNTDPAAVFDCMRQAEFRRAIAEAFGSVPPVPNSQIYRTAREMFCSLPPATAHDLMVRQVKTRGKRKPFVELINTAPVSLKHVCLNFTRSPRMATAIAERLNQPLT